LLDRVRLDVYIDLSAVESGRPQLRGAVRRTERRKSRLPGSAAKVASCWISSFM
jgi:hypothetical protein